MANLDYLGVAPAFPIQLTNGGALELTAGVDNVIRAITDVLDTPVGSRFFLRDYGSRLHKLIYQQNDNVLFGLLREVVKEAIENWEGRAEFTDIQYDISQRDKGLINLLISVRIRAINEITSFVYPFYLKLTGV